MNEELLLTPFIPFTLAPMLVEACSTGSQK